MFDYDFFHTREKLSAAQMTIRRKKRLFSPIKANELINYFAYNWSLYVIFKIYQQIPRWRMRLNF